MANTILRFKDMTFEKVENYDPENAAADKNGMVSYWVAKTPDGEQVVTGENKKKCISGEQRTGCMFCAFGAHMEKCPNRFQRMAMTHPRHYQICMELKNNGVRYQDALETCGIETETWEQNGQMNIMDFLA